MRFDKEYSYGDEHDAWKDFAGKVGTPIIATGSGVVTFSGERSGYGKMVEINHGNGITTRYGHAAELVVESGEIVRTGKQLRI